jgi:hypothetical protein
MICRLLLDGEAPRPSFDKESFLDESTPRGCVISGAARFGAWP